MFSRIDTIIFPDSCEVIQTSSQQFLYPIFKNGRSTLKKTAARYKWSYVSDVKEIDKPITVFLRNPKERFISGVNTYVQHLQQANPGLDTNTILFFVNQYLFLNTHYCPQFFWLINLAKHTDVNIQIHLDSINNLSKITPWHSDAEVSAPGDEFLKSIATFDWNQLELYFYLDQLLIDRIGQTLTFSQLYQAIKNESPELCQLVFSHSLELANVLS